MTRKPRSGHSGDADAHDWRPLRDSGASWDIVAKEGFRRVPNYNFLDTGPFCIMVQPLSQLRQLELKFHSGYFRA
jgi:hypothetical protein